MTHLKRNKRLLFGVGVFDEKGCSKTKAYQKWFDMLKRCYCESLLKDFPSYEGCSVCEEWLTFSVFKEWFEDHKNGYQEGYHLDKDILVKGNKVYSPATCCFVPNEINTLLITRRGRRGSCPIGVSISQNTPKGYISVFSKYGKVRVLGRFNSIEDAFRVYKIAKEQYIKELADKYYQQGKITKKVYDALVKYEVEITD